MVRVDRMAGCGRDMACLRVILILGGISLIQGYICVSAAADQTDESQPSAAFLEFLADWEDEKGEWQDPMEYREMVLDPLEKKVEQVDE